VTAVAEDLEPVPVWGAGHLPGMGDLLLHNDFRLVEVRWVPAVRRWGHRENPVIDGRKG
jgi:hypothetical protein